MALQSTIDKLNAARKAYDDQLKALGKDLGAEVAAHLGAHLPDGFVLEWRQGTPSFNDGEPCRFRVNDAYVYRPQLDETGEDPDEYEHPEERGYRDGEYDPKTRSFWIGSSTYGRPWKTYNGEEQMGESLDGLTVEQYDALTAAWRALPADLMEHAFGDGTIVKVYSDGTFKTREYYG